MNVKLECLKIFMDNTTMVLNKKLELADCLYQWVYKNDSKLKMECFKMVYNDCVKFEKALFAAKEIYKWSKNNRIF